MRQTPNVVLRFLIYLVLVILKYIPYLLVDSLVVHDDFFQHKLHFQHYKNTIYTIYTQRKSFTCDRFQNIVRAQDRLIDTCPTKISGVFSDSLCIAFDTSSSKRSTIWACLKFRRKMLVCYWCGCRFIWF